MKCWCRCHCRWLGGALGWCAVPLAVCEVRLVIVSVASIRGRGVAGGAVAGCERVLVVLGCSRCGHSTGTPAATLPLPLLLPPFYRRRHARHLVAMPRALAASGTGCSCRQHLLLVPPVLAARAASAHEQLAACAKGRQHLLLVRGLPLPVYEVVSSEGPAHAPVFTISVSVEGVKPAQASANSKRAAEQAAAAKLLEQL